jgi:uncharacterized protein (TIGR02466 family)
MRLQRNMLALEVSRTVTLWQAMSEIFNLFPTQIYRAEKATPETLTAALEVAVHALVQNDTLGHRWCEKNGFPGYTSYGSQTHLGDENPAFQKLIKLIDKHALTFAKALHWDIGSGRPICDSIWVNVLPEGGSHSGHIHTNSVISGTFYVKVPEGAGPIVFEDPRYPQMMAAPPRKKSAGQELKTHVSFAPEAGTLMLWESWLRHEVPLNRAPGERISVSFNYVIG